MKYYFLINPNAGKGKAAEFIKPKIEQYIAQTGIDAEIYMPTSGSDGREFVHNKCMTGEQMRVYACGGDGTLFQIINGAYGFDNVEVGIIPLGSGNDFAKMLGDKETLLDVENQVEGAAVKFDLVKSGDTVGISHCSVGLDAVICAKKDDFNKPSFMTGEMAYVASTLYCFLGKIARKITVKIDDDEPFTINSIFCLAANAQWYGGGFKSAPYAKLTDGKLDFIVVEKKLSKLKLFPIIAAYKSGNHLTGKYDDFVTFKQGKKITVHSDTPIPMICDGESSTITDATFEIVEKGINFIVPKNCEYYNTHKDEFLSPATV